MDLTVLSHSVYMGQYCIGDCTYQDCVPCARPRRLPAPLRALDSITIITESARGEDRRLHAPSFGTQEL
jgi:hypothetical protein